MNRLATLTNLKKRNILFPEESKNCRCYDAGISESAEHLFIHCVVAQTVWRKIQTWLKIHLDLTGDLETDILSFAAALPSKSKETWMVIWHGTLWYIWKDRNSSIFSGIILNAEEIFDMIKWNTWNWLQGRSLIRRLALRSDWDLFPLDCLSI